MKSNRFALQTDGIGKCYRIGVKDELSDSFASSIFSFIKSPLKNYRKYRSLYKFDDIDLNNPSRLQGESGNVFWALRNISFSVEEGDSLAIIGQNGAGKSTLLKILCRITAPTCGRALVRGTISSLLEVGTGFHQELTGRENIYLNGTILGMTKKEVDARLDEIIDFSGVDKFVDTPVKRYSSGMKVRLAFSVAAHLEPEILIVDEVLAVGDADFQKKCLNKMKDIGSRGRTVVFVSHNMQAITRLCKRAILLDGGQIIADGPADEVVAEYLSAGKESMGVRQWLSPDEAPGSDVVKLRSVKAVSGENNSGAKSCSIDKSVKITMEYDVLKPGYIFLPHFRLHNDSGEIICTSVDLDPHWRRKKRPVGRYTSTATIPGNLLAEGLIFVTPAMRTVAPDVHHYGVREAIAFNIIDNPEGDTARGEWGGKLRGIVRPRFDWETHVISNG